MSFRTERINNEVVEAIPLTKAKDTRPVRGHQLFSELFANIFFCAKTKSGKTTVIHKVINDCSGRHTKIIVFSSTLHADPYWDAIRELARKKGLEFTGYTSIIAEDRSNILKTMMDELEQPEEEDAPRVKTSWLDDQVEAEKKEEPEKYQAPDYIFVFDDLSNELKKPVVAEFLKKARHFRAKVIISSQHMTDLYDGARKQLAYVLLFRNHDPAKIEKIRESVDISMDRDEFYSLYKWATHLEKEEIGKKFPFLYVDVRGGTFRRNFNELIEIESD